MLDVPYDRGVKVIGPQFGPKFVYDPKRYWHHQTNQIRPSDKLISFTNSKQFMTVRVVTNKIRRREIKK